MKSFILSLFLFCFLVKANGQTDITYQSPPEEIEELVNAPLPPAVSLSPTGEWMVLMERNGYPDISELAQPELRLAGLRMNPRNNGPSRSSNYMGLILKHIESGETSPVLGLPDVARIENVRWSPNGERLAFTLTSREGISLWVAEVGTKSARALTQPIVNDALGGTPFIWMPDNMHLIARVVNQTRGDAPSPPNAPKGPVVQESAGEKTTLRTYQDLLKNPYDEEVFEYYTSGLLVKINVENKSISDFSDLGIIRSFTASPDGNYVLLSTIKKPFSYLVPYYRFPTDYQVVDANGELIKTIASIPLIEQLPQGFDAVPAGPRSMNWRADQPATLYWTEALDGGDPSVEVEKRDQLFMLPAPFDGKPGKGPALDYRFAGIDWANEDLAIVQERWWSSRQYKTSRFAPKNPSVVALLFEGSYSDRYNDPGDFLREEKPNGYELLLTNAQGSKLYLSGAGASPEGDRPFLREYDLKTWETKELWRSEAPYYEYMVELLDVSKGDFITARESKEEPQNFFLRNFKKNSIEPLTTFENPYPGLDGIQREIVHFKRADGVDLQGELILPAGYDPKKDGRLPVFMWAYPREFKSKSNAGQVSGSPHRFVRLNWGSPIYWVTQGYAIFNNVSMPVVGEGEQEPNDTFREQLVANAEAAIQVLEEKGIADPQRIAIGGHSYGAFMTANLLAHSDLFAAGVARSGAYNRTLTPFGFQREERTYWDDPDIYYTMSPFMHADKINEPLLMIHGIADNNSGTFPLQSERMYAAINGLGGKARLVMLPHESHGYQASQSILHCLWEMDQWLDKYVKRAGKAQP